MKESGLQGCLLQPLVIKADRFFHAWVHIGTRQPKSSPAFPVKDKFVISRLQMAAVLKESPYNSHLMEPLFLE
jgi:hypothetical protein